MFEQFDPEDAEGFSEFMGPGQADDLLRQAMRQLWMSLPASKRSIDVVEQRMKRSLQRALDDWREDEQFRKEE